MQQEPKADDELKDLTFEQALEQLEETVRAMEAGELSLHETTALFERGMRLANFCGDLLSKAELKITQIQTAYGESSEPVDETLI
jgi:exodeoxyribonuclease VII small subunit